MISNALNMPFSTKMKGEELMKTKMQVENLNKSLAKDGKKMQQALGKDDFLKLLVTELQHQDPTNPMKDREFIAQMSQFSSLEQMTNMNKGLDKLLSRVSFESSFSLLGHDVELNSNDIGGEEGANALISGKVDEVSKKGENIFVKVNGESFSVDDIVKVF